MKKYKGALILKAIEASDAEIISKGFKEQGWNKSGAKYEQYFEEQSRGVRDVIVAWLNDEFAGYLTVQWTANYLPFREMNIPEIVDFNVLKKYQRLGIGTILMDEAERRIKKVSAYAGIGFGITSDYGAAQILYIKRGYIPNGKGMVVDSVPVKYLDVITVTDDQVFCLLKKL